LLVGALTASGFPDFLRKGLWHTTTLERFEGIRQHGAILPNPDIPDSERWHTSAGPAAYPYVRTLGGVSLFDFREFDPETYNDKYPLSVWAEFVPFRRQHRCAVWLCINPQSVTNAYIGPGQLLAKWKEGGSLQHTLMPMIEGAHIGPVPRAAIVEVLAAVDGEPVEWSRVEGAWQ
jgi:hypothetical protein